MNFSHDHRRMGRRGYKDRAEPFGGLGRDKVRGLVMAATALSTLQAENEKLRAESIMHHNAADNYRRTKGRRQEWLI